MRQPKQVLAIPFLFCENNLKVLILKRRNSGYWQFVSGGCEDDEQEHTAVLREIYEELGLNNISVLYRLDTINSIPVSAFSLQQKHLWSNNLFVIPEKVFAFKINDQDRITLSSEHDEYLILDYYNALNLLKWDSNKTALWELSQLLSFDLIEKKRVIYE